MKLSEKMNKELEAVCDVIAPSIFYSEYERIRRVRLLEADSQMLDDLIEMLTWDTNPMEKAIKIIHNDMKPREAIAAAIKEWKK